MFKRSKTRSPINVFVAIVLAVTLSLSIGAFSLGFAQTEADIYFEDNKETVEIIDSGAVYFAELKSAYVADVSSLESMQKIVEVATALNEFKGDYLKTDYTAENWTRLQKIIDQTIAYARVESDNYKNYDSQKYLARIEKEKVEIEKIETIEQSYLEFVEENLKRVNDSKNLLTKPNSSNPDIENNQIVGYLDDKALAEVEYIATKAQQDISETSLVKNLYESSFDSVEAIADKAIEDMQAVKKNDVERAYDTLEDYYAIKKGEAEGVLDLAKLKAEEDIAKAQEFLSSASKAVKDNYTSEAILFDKFLAGEELNDESFRKRDIISTESGSVVVKAFAIDNGEKTPLAVFPAAATLSVYENLSSARENARVAINKQCKDLGVGYLASIKIYHGISEWNTVTEVDGKEVVYEVTIDLNAYYSEFVENDTTFIEDTLANVGLKSKTNENKLSKILEAQKIMATADASLLYIYLGRGEIKALDYSIDTSGGILMFETNSFNNFAIAQCNESSIFANPFFYLIALIVLVLLVVIIVALIKNKKFVITFHSNGGTKVAPIKVKKGESFSMPKSPSRQGYIFGGWYEDKLLKVRFIDTYLETRGAKKVYAKWYKILSAKDVDNYFNKLKSYLASFSVLGEAFEVEDGEGILLAKLVKENDELKFYVAIEQEKLSSDGFNVVDSKGANFESVPSVITINTREAYAEAVEIANILIEEYELLPIQGDYPDGDSFDFIVTGYNEEDFVEEVEEVEEAQEEVIEEKAEEVQEEVIEETQEEVEEVASEEDLVKYYKALRTFAKGYALAENNDKVSDGMALLKLYVASDAVKLFVNLNAQEYGLEEGKGDTPALKLVTNEKTFNEAKELIVKLMAYYGLEETGEDVGELKEAGAGNGFCYRLHFSTEE